MTAYDDNGAIVTAGIMSLDSYEKAVNFAENIFTQDISNATYITYSSEKDLVGFQLNGS